MKKKGEAKTVTIGLPINQTTAFRIHTKHFDFLCSNVAIDVLYRPEYTISCKMETFYSKWYTAAIHPTDLNANELISYLSKW